MARPAQPRLSIEPLIVALALNDVTFGDTTPHGIALKKGKMNGYVTLTMADEFACKVLKVHPFDVWGQEYEDSVWFDMGSHDDNDTDPNGGGAALPSNVIAFPAPKVQPETFPVREYVGPRIAVAA